MFVDYSGNICAIYHSEAVREFLYSKHSPPPPLLVPLLSVVHVAKPSIMMGVLCWSALRKVSLIANTYNHIYLFVFGNIVVIELTSNPRLDKSCSTAQDDSKSRPLIFMDPNLMEVEGLDGAWMVGASLVWRDFLNCFLNFCLCFWGT